MCTNHLQVAVCGNCDIPGGTLPPALAALAGSPFMHSVVAGSPLMHEETFRIESLFKQNPRALKSNRAHEKCPLTSLSVASTLLQGHLVSCGAIMSVALPSCQLLLPVAPLCQ